MEDVDVDYSLSNTKYLKKETNVQLGDISMASPVDLQTVFGQFLQIIPWIMVIALLPVILRSIVDAIKQFKV